MTALIHNLVDKIFGSPVSTMAGVAAAAITFVVHAGSGFTWQGLETALPSLILGALSTDSTKSSGKIVGS